MVFITTIIHCFKVDRQGIWTAGYGEVIIESHEKEHIRCRPDSVFRQRRTDQFCDSCESPQRVKERHGDGRE